MSDVDFEEQDWQINRQEVEKPPSFLVKLVLKTGVVKDVVHANYVLLGLAVVFFILTIFTVVKANGGFNRAGVVDPALMDNASVNP